MSDEAGGPEAGEKEREEEKSAREEEGKEARADGGKKKEDRGRKVRFINDEEYHQKDVHDELYDNDDSIYNKISILKDMKQKKVTDKKEVMMYGSYNDAASGVESPVTDFWQYGLKDVHNSHDVHIVACIEKNVKRVSEMSKRLIQADICKKMVGFLNHTFKPVFHSEKIRKGEKREDVGYNDSIEDIVHLM